MPPSRRLCKSAEAIGLDIETTALSPRDGGVRLLQLATPEETFVIDAFEVSDLSPLTEVLEDGPVKVGHNLKFDYQFLHALYGISLSPVFDTMLAAQVLYGGNYAASYSLEAVAERYLDESLDKSEQRSDWSGELSEAQLEYAARDARVLLPLRERLAEALEEEELGRISSIEFAAVATIAEMELAGVKLDVARWKELEVSGARATRPGRRAPGVLLPAAGRRAAARRARARGSTSTAPSRSPTPSGTLGHRAPRHQGLDPPQGGPPCGEGAARVPGTPEEARHLPGDLPQLHKPEDRPHPRELPAVPRPDRASRLRGSEYPADTARGRVPPLLCRRGWQHARHSGLLADRA